MSLTWKDGLATALVGAAAALYLLWVSDTTVAGLTGIRALTVAVFALGVGGCYAARSEMAAVYGAGGGPRPPLLYVVLATILGGVTLVAGIVAFAGGGEAALATLTGRWPPSAVQHRAGHLRSSASPTRRAETKASTIFSHRRGAGGHLHGCGKVGQQAGSAQEASITSRGVSSRSSIAHRSHDAGNMKAPDSRLRVRGRFVLWAILGSKQYHEDSATFA